MCMKLWIDDLRPAPAGYIWVKSVFEAQQEIERIEHNNWPYGDAIEIIDIDHDAGDYVNQGGDYIRLLDWFEETGRNYLIHIHSQNVVGVANMRAIIERNGWKEIK